MQTFENLYSRRSVRSYTGEGPGEAQLAEILKSAYAAPVGKAQYQSLHLTVIENKDYLSRWEAAVGEATGNPDAHPFYGAPVMVLVSSVVPEAPLDNVAYSNAAILAEHMSLAAVELGLGSCLIWGAVRVLNTRPDLVAELPIPEGMKPCCGVIVGKTDVEYALREVAENRIKTDKF